jgi:hypothetical protein
MQANLGNNVDSQTLYDIPKDVIIQHIIPNIQQELTTENNHLKALVTKLIDKLKSEGVSTCSYSDGSDGCFKNPIDVVICSFCDVVVCSGHSVKKPYHYRIYGQDRNFLTMHCACEKCAKDGSPFCHQCELCDSSPVDHLSIGEHYFWNGSSWALDKFV